MVSSQAKEQPPAGLPAATLVYFLYTAARVIVLKHKIMTFAAQNPPKPAERHPLDFILSPQGIQSPCLTHLQPHWLPCKFLKCTFAPADPEKPSPHLSDLTPPPALFTLQSLHSIHHDLTLFEIFILFMYHLFSPSEGQLLHKSKDLPA